MHLDDVTVFSLVFGVGVFLLGLYEKRRLDRIEFILSRNLEAYEASQAGRTPPEEG